MTLPAHRYLRRAASKPDIGGKTGMVSLDLPKGTIAPIDGGLDDHHLTVVFLGSDVDDDPFDEVCTYARGVASTFDGPLSGTVGGTQSRPRPRRAASSWTVYG